MFKHILCPVDGSNTSLQALELAARLAKEQNAQLTICMAVDAAKAAAMAFGDPGMSAACYSALYDEARASLASISALVTDVQPDQMLVEGAAIEAIVECAVVKACDLIVIGSHGRSGIKRALVGSVAEGVVRTAAVPVMVVRRGSVGKRFSQLETSQETPHGQTAVT